MEIRVSILLCTPCSPFFYFFQHFSAFSTFFLLFFKRSVFLLYSLFLITNRIHPPNPFLGKGEESRAHNPIFNKRKPAHTSHVTAAGNRRTSSDE